MTMTMTIQKWFVVINYMFRDDELGILFLIRYNLIVVNLHQIKPVSYIFFSCGKVCEWRNEAAATTITNKQSIIVITRGLWYKTVHLHLWMFHGNAIICRPRSCFIFAFLLKLLFHGLLNYLHKNDEMLLFLIRVGKLKEISVC